MGKQRARISKIINTLKINNAATIRELADMLSVSEMTVRRDLRLLAGDNIVKLIHGGAVFNPNSIIEKNEGKYSLSAEENRRTAEKIRIGRKAATLLEPDDIIIIDAGSTTECLAKAIPDNIPITIMCYTLNALLEVQRKNDCRLIFAGGYYHDNTMMFESPEGVELIKRIRANKAFISAGGVNHRLGVTCSNHYETETKKAALNSSLIKVLLVDSSKFGRIRPTYFADLDDFDIVITDTGISEEYADIITGLKLTLYTV